jgi:hypothetical protein
MTPPSPLFPCTCLGDLAARPTRNSVPQGSASPSHLARAHRLVIANEARALPPIPQPRAEGARPFTHSTCPTKHVFPALPFRYNISYCDIFPEPGPSGVTIYLSSRPNTGDHSVSGGHA